MLDHLSFAGSARGSHATVLSFPYNYGVSRIYPGKGKKNVFKFFTSNVYENDISPASLVLQFILLQIDNM